MATLLVGVIIILCIHFPSVFTQAGPPVITGIRSNVTAVIGQSLTLNCNASGSEPIHWQWNYKGKCPSLMLKCLKTVPLPDGNVQFIYKVNLQNGSLFITSTLLEDSGDYWCIASNTYGNDSHRIVLNVRKIVRVDGELQERITDFDPALLDSNSLAYKALEKKYIEIMDQRFKNRPWYSETQILGFRNLTKNRMLIEFRVLADISDTAPEQVAEDVASDIQPLLLNPGLSSVIPGSFKLKVRPLPPQNLASEDVKENQVFISWELPRFYEFFDIHNYTVHYKKSTQDKWLVAESGFKFDNDITTYGLKNLDESTKYDVRMFAFNKYGLSNPSASLTVETSSGVDVLPIVLLIFGSVIAVVVLVIIAICIFRRQRDQQVRRRSNRAEENSNRYEVKSNFYSASYKRYLEDRRVSDGAESEDNTWWEIPEDKLQLGDVIGSGEFGVVVKGVVDIGDEQVNCAVKMLKEYAVEQEFRDLFSELILMTGISKHPNLVNLIGARTMGYNLMIVVEYCQNGCLLKYLQSHRAHEYINIQNEASPLTFVQKLQIAWDISKGMTHLQNLKCVHRDLAARNVLLTDTLQAKVSDFGMSRDIYEKGFYEKTTSGKLPVKWMAIESLKQMQFTSKSDVWSFGVVLWEIETGGLVPYPGIQGKHMLQELLAGYRMEKPQNCEDVLYEMMQKCWQADFHKRPSFEELQEELEQLLTNESGYLSMEAGNSPDGHVNLIGIQP